MCTPSKMFFLRFIINCIFKICVTVKRRIEKININKLKQTKVKLDKPPSLKKLIFSFIIIISKERIKQKIFS